MGWRKGLLVLGRLVGWYEMRLVVEIEMRF